jgi:hypothetical protein
MRRLIGIDPGLAGGLGVLDLGERGEVLGVALHRTPTLTIRRGRKARVEYDMPAMRKLLDDCCHHRRSIGVEAGLTPAALRGLERVPVELMLEEQQAMPAALRGRNQGGRSTFRTGLGYGLWLGLVVAAGVPYQTVRPATWKKHHGLLGADKRASRLRCAQRFPALGAIAAKDEGPAEALLLAAFAATQKGVPNA